MKRKYYIEDGICYVDTPYKNQYDEDGRLVKQTEGDGYLGMETEYFYGAQGNVIREIARSTYLDEQFYDTVYGYDEAGRRLEVTCDQSNSEAGVHLWYGYVYFDDPEETP